MLDSDWVRLRYRDQALERARLATKFPNDPRPGLDVFQASILLKSSVEFGPVLAMVLVCELQVTVLLTFRLIRP
jgi:hypothetical protein